MDYDHIKALLEKYWNCETSVEEEAQLQAYFSEPDIPEELKVYQPLFNYFRSHKKVKPGEDFEQRILSNLEGDRKPGRQRYLNIFYKVAAAVILILFFVTIHQRFIAVREKAELLVKDTYEDPRKALEETKKALLLVSEKWKIGQSNVNKINEFNKAEKIIRNENM